MPGDADDDGDVDLADYLGFELCFTGSGTELRDFECYIFDLDFDGDVDLPDLLGLQAAFTGAR